MKIVMLKTYSHRKAGEEYKVPLKIGRAYIKVGIAREVPDEPEATAPQLPVATPTYQTRHMQAAEAEAPSAPTKAVRKAPAKRVTTRSTDTPAD